MNFRCPQCRKVLVAPDDPSVAQGKCPRCGAIVNLAAARGGGLATGTVVGGCRVDGLVGRGGMAAVYLATQLSLDRPVALKVLAPHLARREHFVERFDREATALAQLSHANIVNILDKGTEDGTCYFVMEFVEGESLRERLTRRGKLPFAEAARVFDQVAAGLQYAHGQSVLHRDIKPENILITPKGEAKLADFGIARMAGDDAAAQHRLTVAQTRMGTAHYMAPEQVRDAASVDHRADIYALGVTLYEMLTGELPIGQFRPPSRVSDEVPHAVDPVVSTALAASPDERFQSVTDFQAALRAASAAPAERVHDRLRARARKRAWKTRALVAGILLVILGGVAAVVAFGPGRSEPRIVAQPPPPPPKPSEAEKREDKANELLALASRRAALGRWSEAKDLLAELETTLADTKLYTENQADISELRKHAEAMLQPKPPPKPKESPKAEPEPKAKAEPLPPPKKEPGPKAGPGPKTKAESESEPKAKAVPPPKEAPKQEPLPEAGQWVLFDGTSLDGWRIVDPTPGPRPKGANVSLAGGQLAIDGGKRVVGVVWTQPLPRQGYELALEAMRTGGHGVLAYVVFPVGDGACSLALGGPAGSGLDAVDGHSLPRNETRRDLALENDRWYKISVRVTPTRIEARVDDSTLVSIARADHEFSLPDWCTEFQPLGIAAWRTSAAVRSVRLRRLLFAPPKVVKADPSPAEDLLAKVRPLWAQRSYDAALDAARAALAEAKDDEAQKTARAIVRAAEVLPRLWTLIAAGADALKGKPFTSKGVTGRIIGVKDDALHLGVGPAQTSRKLATLETPALLSLAKAGLATADADAHLALALFAAFDEQPDLALARRQLDAAKAAGADADGLAPLIALSGMPAFRKALAAARQKLEAGDTRALKQLLGEALKLKPECPEAARVVEAGLQTLLGQTVAAANVADFAKANDLMGFAQAFDAGHPDVVKLAEWLKASSKPVLVETFDGPRLDRWVTETGLWRISGGRLVSRTLWNDVALIFLQTPQAGLRNFVFTFDAGNSADARSYRFGVVFRERRRGEEKGSGQFLYCFLSGTHSLLCAGGATAYGRMPVGVVDGVRFRYTRQEPLYLGGQRFPVEVGRLYHMTVRCAGNAFQCYVNDQPVVEGLTGSADAGRIGLLVHGGECVFDNVKLYTPTPPPELTLLGGEVEVTDPEEPQEQSTP